MIFGLGIYFIVVSVIVSVFQVALGLGAPLGEFTLGGKYPGKLPKNIRLLTIIQIIILWVFAYIVSVKSLLLKNQPTQIGNIGIWFVVVFFLLGSVMNGSSPSKKERYLWGPVNVMTFIATLLIAILG